MERHAEKIVEHLDGTPQLEFSRPHACPRVCVLLLAAFHRPPLLPLASGRVSAPPRLLIWRLSCFFGYRLFKFVLGIFGFIIGALAASSVLGASDTTSW